MKLTRTEANINWMRRFGGEPAEQSSTHEIQKSHGKRFSLHIIWLQSALITDKQHWKWLAFPAHRNRLPHALFSVHHSRNLSSTCFNSLIIADFRAIHDHFWFDQIQKCVTRTHTHTNNGPYSPNWRECYETLIGNRYGNRWLQPFSLDISIYDPIDASV